MEVMNGRMLGKRSAAVMTAEDQEMLRCVAQQMESSKHKRFNEQQLQEQLRKKLTERFNGVARDAGVAALKAADQQRTASLKHLREQQRKLDQHKSSFRSSCDAVQERIKVQEHKLRHAKAQIVSAAEDLARCITSSESAQRSTSDDIVEACLEELNEELDRQIASKRSMLEALMRVISAIE